MPSLHNDNTELTNQTAPRMCQSLRNWNGELRREQAGSCDLAAAISP